MSERLKKIKKRWESVQPWISTRDRDWLIAEVERLEAVEADLQSIRKGVKQVINSEIDDDAPPTRIVATYQGDGTQS